MTSVEPSSRVGVALDLILKTLISSQDFNNLASKNWETIARLIPGTTPSQVGNKSFLLIFRIYYLKNKKQ